MTSGSAKDFFISYTKADRAWAEWIAWKLEEAGYITVLQAWDFSAGSNFVIDMHNAARNARRTIALLSPDYLQSLFAQPEWAAAFVQDPTGEKGTLLPVRVRPCKPDGLLTSISYIDLVDLGEAAAQTTLLAKVRATRAKPSHPPSFPGKAVSTAYFPGKKAEIGLSPIHAILFLRDAPDCWRIYVQDLQLQSLPLSRRPSAGLAVSARRRPPLNTPTVMNIPIALSYGSMPLALRGYSMTLWDWSRS